jgi:3-deoxy-D-manno-octulosonic-acid transferase/heptosyltransferase-1
VRPYPASLSAALKRQGEALTLLVVRLGAMGDILRTLPAVRLIRRRLSRARIVWVLDSHWRVVLDGHDEIDQIVEVPRKDWNRWIGSPAAWGRLFRSVADLKRRLRDQRPSLALDFQGNLRSGWIARLAGAPVRLGYDGHQQKEGNRWFSTHRVASGDRRTPRLERNLGLVRALGIPVGPLPEPELPLARAGASGADSILAALPAATAGYAILSPGASISQAYKKPPAELLVAASRRLSERGVGALVVYGPGEEGDARRVVELAEPAAIFAPPTDLPTLAALLDRARLFVGGDSGPLHMACAVGCPVVGVYGPTDPRVNEPWGTEFVTVYPPDRVYTGIKRLDRDAGAFEGLTGRQVARAVDELLDRTHGRGGA